MRGGARLPWPEVLLYLAVLAALHVFVGSSNNVLAGNFLDTDVYTWLNRVELLHAHGDWFDRRLPQVNPPKGHLQHWSRPFDVLLYTGAALGAPFVGFRSALEQWALWVSPVLHGLTLLVLLFAVRPIMPGPGLARISALFLLGHGALVTSFAVGRADHQSLLLFLCIAALGLMVRVLRPGSQQGWCYAVGMTLALGVWVSVEFMLVVGLLQLAGGLLWLAGGADLPEKSWRIAVGLLVAGSLSVWAHGGLAGFGSATTDEVSGLYWALFLAAAVFWGVAWVLQQRGRLRRWPQQLGYAATGAGVVAAGAWVLLGDDPTGPLGDVDSLYERVRLGNLGELQSLLAWQSLVAGDIGKVLARMLPDLGLLLPALVLAAGVPRLLAGNPDLSVRAALVGAVGVLVFVPLACYQIRWTGYAALLLVPVAAGGTLWLIAWLRDRLSQRGAEWAGILLVAAFALGFNFIPRPAVADGQGTAVRTTGGSSLAALAAYLGDPLRFGSAPLKIMAFVDYGPELIYRTQRHTVCAMPNHRPQPGFVASYEAFTAPTAALARAAVTTLAVDLVLVGDHPIETSFYAVRSGRDTFHSQLLRGAAPAWLSPVPLPAGLGAFKLYRVLGGGAR